MHVRNSSLSYVPQHLFAVRFPLRVEQQADDFLIAELLYRIETHTVQLIHVRQYKREEKHEYDFLLQKLRDSIAKIAPGACRHFGHVSTAIAGQLQHSWPADINDVFH